MKFLLILFTCLVSIPLFAETVLTPVLVEELVRNTVCKNGMTIDQALQKKLKKRSQRDLGWKVFFENEKYDIEKAILINKSMQIRYRWQVDQLGAVTPVSKRAQKLCI